MHTEKSNVIYSFESVMHDFIDEMANLLLMWVRLNHTLLQVLYPALTGRYKRRSVKIHLVFNLLNHRL